MATKKQVQAKTSLIESVKKKVMEKLAENKITMLEIKVETLLTEQMETEAEIESIILMKEAAEEKLEAIKEKIANL